MSEGRLRVQLPQVNTQKLSSTTRPRSSASRSGWSALIQLSFASSGAGLPLSAAAVGRGEWYTPVPHRAAARVAVEIVSNSRDRRCMGRERYAPDRALRWVGGLGHLSQPSKHGGSPPTVSRAALGAHGKAPTRRYRTPLWRALAPAL